MHYICYDTNQSENYISLHNKIVMVLRDIIITECTDRAKRALFSGDMNFASTWTCYQ
jgi:hypothetical protein